MTVRLPSEKTGRRFSAVKLVTHVRHRAETSYRRKPIGTLAAVMLLSVIWPGTSNAGIVYEFRGGKLDGEFPYYSGLIFDTSGNLYGTTSYGTGRHGGGTVYKLDATGNETIVHTFLAREDGRSPFAGVIMDANGNLYGTTRSGGDTNAKCVYSHKGGCGVVFKIDGQGKETVLHAFKGGEDGAEPVTSLVLDTEGSL